MPSVKKCCVTSSWARPSSKHIWSSKPSPNNGCPAAQITCQQQQYIHTTAATIAATEQQRPPCGSTATAVHIAAIHPLHVNNKNTTTQQPSTRLADSIATTIAPNSPTKHPTKNLSNWSCNKLTQHNRTKCSRNALHLAKVIVTRNPRQKQYTRTRRSEHSRSTRFFAPREAFCCTSRPISASTFWI